MTVKRFLFSTVQKIDALRCQQQAAVLSPATNKSPSRLCPTRKQRQSCATPSPGWGPRGRAPAKITGLFMFKKIEKDQMATLCSVFHGGWSRRLSHTHSYPGCHAPDRLVVALADHGCSQYTSIAAYDYS